MAIVTVVCRRFDAVSIMSASSRNRRDLLTLFVHSALYKGKIFLTEMPVRVRIDPFQAVGRSNPRAHGAALRRIADRLLRRLGPQSPLILRESERRRISK